MQVLNEKGKLHSVALQNRKVLVLNKNWNAINVVSLKRALKLLFTWYPEEIEDGKIIRPAEPKAKVLNRTSYRKIIEGDFSDYSWQDWANILPKEDDETVNSIFKLPEIILLTRYGKQPQQFVRFNRKTIYKRDSYTCQYCGDQLSSEEVSIDHIIPKSLGGATSWQNCCLSCLPCNSQKRDRRPEDAYKDRRNWKGPSPMRLINGMPKEPKRNLFQTESAFACNSWSDFLSEKYWTCDLKNDMND